MRQEKIQHGLQRLVFATCLSFALVLGCDSSDPNSGDDPAGEEPNADPKPQPRSDDSVVAFAVDFDDSVSVYISSLDAITTLQRISTGGWSEPLAAGRTGALFVNPGSDCLPVAFSLETQQVQSFSSASSLCPIRAKHAFWLDDLNTVLFDPYEPSGASPNLSAIDLNSGSITSILQSALPLSLSGDSLLVAIPGQAPGHDHRFGIFSISQSTLLDSASPAALRFRTGIPFDPELTASLNRHLNVVAFADRSGSTSRLYVGDFEELPPDLVYSTPNEIHSVKVGSDGYVYMSVHPDPGRLGGARIERIRVIGDNLTYRSEIVLSEDGVPGSIGIGWAVFD